MCIRDSIYRAHYAAEGIRRARVYDGLFAVLEQSAAMGVRHAVATNKKQDAAEEVCRIFGLDYRAAARAGLLHDLYLQKWEETDVGRFRRLVIHPQLALENARAFGLSPMEEDIIGKHMWPLTAPLPYYKESYMVSLADKICATLEMAHLYGLLGVRRNLRACRPALLRRAVQ